MNWFHAKRQPIAGISLVEVLISTALVGTMIVASLETVGAVYRTQRLNAARQLAPGLAQQLMSEVLSFAYEDADLPGGAIGTETGETDLTREDFDDVDDFDGWDRTDPVFRDDTLLSGYTGWRRQVTVEWADPATGAVSTETETGLKRITVTVTDPDGEVTELVTFRSEEGALEYDGFSTEVTIVHWLGAELQVGSCPYITHGGTRLVNYATDVN